MGQNKQVTKTAGMISGLTMISRIFGYVRDGIGGAILGAGFANDAYLAAFRIPNLLRDLFAEGALSSAFIPTFTSTRVKEGDARAWQLTSIVVNAIIILMSALIIAAEIGAPYLVGLIVPGFEHIPEKAGLTTQLTRILLPFLGFISLAAVLMGILNSREKFGLPAFAPVMMNVAMIACGLFLCPLFGDRPEAQVVGWAWGALLGGFLQMAIQVPAVFKLGFRWRPIFHWQDPGLQRIIKLMLPAVAGLSVTQINLFINTIIASFLPEGTVTYLYYGNRLMQLPLGVFGVAIATALLPITAQHLAKGEKGKLIGTLSFGLRLLVIVIVPCMVGLIVLSEPINRLLFEYGRFTPEAVRAVSLASIAYSLGLVAFAGVKVVVPTFYAMDNAKIPLHAAIVAVAINIVLNLILMKPLGYMGLALATSVSAVVNFGFLIWHLRRALGHLDAKRIFDTSWRVGLASCAMGFLVWSGSHGWLTHAGAGMPRMELALKVFALICTGAFGYAAFAWFFQVPEYQKLWNVIQSKVGLGGAQEPWVE